jgi:hypothetical protein
MLGHSLCAAHRIGVSTPSLKIVERAFPIRGVRHAIE